MKKIGVLAFRDKNGGGVYQYTQSIIDVLKLDKSKTYIIFCNTSDKSFDNSNIEVRKLDIPQNHLKEKIIRAIQHIFTIRKPYLFTQKEIDIFKDIDLFLSPAISPYPHFYMNKPFIFTLHDMQERYYPEFFSRQERFGKWLYNRSLAKNATKIICESSFVKNDIVKFIGVDKNKINIIQSPPTEEFLNYTFKKEKFNFIKQKYRLPDKYIFYPAQCWFHKNHIKLVEAFHVLTKEYNNIFLVLTGSQQNNYSNLMKKVDDLKLNKKILHLGYIDYEDLPYIYKMSSMLVMPTLFESISIPIYEAFTLQVPVCSSNVVALPEQVGEAGLLFDPHNPVDMAQKMKMYLDDKKLMQEKSKQGLEKIINFNYDKYKAELVGIIDESL